MIELAMKKDWDVSRAMIALALASLFCGFMDIAVGLCGYVIPSYIFGLFMLANGIALVPYILDGRRRKG